MNLLQTLIASAKVGEALDFGILENIILKDVTNEDQIQDGQVKENNCYMRFQRYDDKGKVIQESRFNYWNADPTKDKAPVEHLLLQIQQLAELSTAVGGNCAEKFGTQVAEIIVSTENLEEKARSTKKGVAKAFQKEIVDCFVECIKPCLADEPKLRLKVVTSWNGKYKSLPSTVPMVESMDIPAKDSQLSISHLERLNSMKDEPEATETAAAVGGTAPKANPILDL